MMKHGPIALMTITTLLACCMTLHAQSTAPQKKTPTVTEQRKAEAVKPADKTVVPPADAKKPDEKTAPVKKESADKTAGTKTPADEKKQADPAKDNAPAAKEPGTPATPADKKSVDPKKEAAEAEKVKKRQEAEKKKADWIEKTMDYGINKDRKEAINQILSIKDPGLKARLGEKLVVVLKTETDPEVKVRAITVAGDMKIAAAGPEFVRLLEDDSEDVRVAAAHGIGGLAYEPGRPVLVEKFKTLDFSKDGPFNDACITVLGNMKGCEVREKAEAAISDGHTTKNNRENLMLFFGRAGCREAKDFMLKIYRDDDEDREVRSYAVNGIGRMGIKEAAADIEEVVKKIEAYPQKKKRDHYGLYIYSVAALAKLGDDRAFPRLMDALKSDSAMVRLKAIKLVREMKDKRTIDILKYKRDYDPNPSVQKAAREAIEEIEGVPAKKSTPDTPEVKDDESVRKPGRDAGSRDDGGDKLLDDDERQMK